MTAYPKLVIYYFSGTGNSGNVAHWMADIAKEKDMEVSLINIAKTERRCIESPGPDAVVAFCSPIHGFNYPPVMLNFILRFPKAKNHVLLPKYPCRNAHWQMECARPDRHCVLFFCLNPEAERLFDPLDVSG